MKIEKRDGKLVDFDSNKIKEAIKKASKSSSEKLSDEDIEKVVSFVEKSLGDADSSVEEIQEFVEDGLMHDNHYETAKTYIKYREERTAERFKRLEITKEIKEKLDASNIQNQNANVDESSFGGRKGEADSALMKQMALDYYISPKFTKNHKDNRVYIHDLDSYVLGDHNCAIGSTLIKVKINNDVKTLSLDNFSKLLNILTLGTFNLIDKNIQILSRNGWTTLKSITIRKTKEGEDIFNIKTRSGMPLCLTGEHKVPVIQNGKESTLLVKDIKVGDSLISSDINISGNDDISSFSLNLLDLSDIDLRIVNLTPLRHYLRYKYGVCLAIWERENGISENFKNLKIQDFKKLISEYPISFDMINTLRIKTSNSKHTYPLYIPYSESLAKLYAYIYADGGVYVSEEESLFQLTFTNTNEEMVDDFIKCYKEVFGYSLNKSYPSWDSTSPCIRVTDGSKLVVKLFKDFAGAKKYGASDISMPDFVINGPQNIKYAYLSASIDTDGCKSSRGIIYTTCGDSYSNQFMALLGSLGYHPIKNMQYKAGSVYRFGKKSGKRNYNCYTIIIGRNDEEYTLQVNTDCLKFNDKYTYKGISNNFNEQKIIKITTEQKDCNVYDLETEDHWFIANDYVIHNCLSIPFDHLLSEGFQTRQTDVRPANSVNTAMQLIAVIFQIQSLQQFGGVSATHLDWTMVPYVRKSFLKHFKDGVKYIEAVSLPDIFKDTDSIEDKKYSSHHRAYEYAMDMTEKECKQSCEGLFHNLNTLQSRAGDQLPFTSINYGTCTLPEGRMITKALLNAALNGVGKFHLTPIFPCCIFQYKKGINDKPGTPNYDLKQLAIKSLVRRIYPNFANCDWSNQKSQIEYDRSMKQEVLNNLSEDDKNKLIELIEKNSELEKKLSLKIEEKKLVIDYEEQPYEMFSTMGCRTANGTDINFTKEDYLKNINEAINTGKIKSGEMLSSAQKDGRGNIAPATIILPTLAMEAKKKSEKNKTDIIEEFFKILEKAIEDCRDELIERFNWICAQSPKSAKFMYENHSMYGTDTNEGIKSELKHGTLAIGQLGLAETIEILIGKNQLTKEGMELAKKIEKLYNDKCTEYKKEFSLNFGVYYSPAENLCYTSMQKFQKKYGKIPNVSEKDYFTNSMHVPVWEKVTPFDKIDTESQLTGYSNAGCITYVECGDNAKNNEKAVEQIVDYAMEKNIPYFAINIPLDSCMKCGYQGSIDNECPVCGAKDAGDGTNIQRLRRVTGYLSQDFRNFNKGKQEEVEDRVKHTNQLNSWNK